MARERPTPPGPRATPCGRPTPAPRRSPYSDASSPGPAEPKPLRANPLTPRECEVAVLVAKGLGNRAIAAELVISEATAERHLGNVFAKLGLTSRAQLAVWALEHGLVPERPA